MSFFFVVVLLPLLFEVFSLFYMAYLPPDGSARISFSLSIRQTSTEVHSRGSQHTLDNFGVDVRCVRSQACGDG